jgi:hypothetical protein
LMKEKILVWYLYHMNWSIFFGVWDDKNERFSPRRKRHSI